MEQAVRVSLDQSRALYTMTRDLNLLTSSPTMLLKVFCAVVFQLSFLAAASPALPHSNSQNSTLISTSPSKILRREAQTVRCIFPADSRLQLLLRPQSPYQAVSITLLEKAAEIYTRFYENRMPMAQRNLWQSLTNITTSALSANTPVLGKCRPTLGSKTIPKSTPTPISRLRVHLGITS